jgi:hypothetical protein
VGRTIENAYLDLRYGGSCARWKRSPYRKFGSRDTESACYAQLRVLFGPRRIPIRPNDVLVDIGCGRGRVINFWLNQGYGDRLIGVELDDAIARRTRERLRPFRNVTILCGNALKNLPAEATVFYLFNPFTLPTVERFKNRLLETYQHRGDIRLVYYNCVAIEVFAGDPAWGVENFPEKSRLFFPSAIVEMRKRNEDS